MKRENTGGSRAGKRERAVAVQYDQERNDAPVVTAKGEGLIAQRIVEIARAADVPVVEDAALVSALLSLELGQEIPVELYEAVARILSWIYKLEKGEQT
jgi:flagellar biosynthesis protein